MVSGCEGAAVPRRRIASVLLCAATVVFLGAGPLHGEQTVSGIVVQAGTDDPLMGTVLRLVPTDGEGRPVGAMTDHQGRFALEAPGPGSYLLVASRMGFEQEAADSLVLEAGERQLVRIEMQPRPIELEGIEVRGRDGLERGRYQFARRAEAGTGFFFDRDAIQALGVEVPEQIFEHVPSVDVDFDGRRPRVRSTEGWGCMLVIYSHTMNVLSFHQYRTAQLSSVGTFMRDLRTAEDPDLDLSRFNLREIEGVEVYRSYHEVPDELKRSLVGARLWPGDSLGGCGLVLIWTLPAW